MPLLAPEPIIHPEDLFAESPSRTSCVWWPFFTQARAEKSLARRLRERDVAYFLPLTRRRWKRNCRVFNSFLPLFPGYVFVFGDVNARLAALQTNLVVRCLDVPDQQVLHADLARVHRLLAGGQPLTTEDRLLPGQKVVVTHGPFVGLEGTVLRRDEELRFVVEVQLLHQGVSLAVEDWMFTLAESAAPAAGPAGWRPSVKGAVPWHGRPRPGRRGGIS
jgi:transcription antitermination factor NusG